jgi:hypothetical protein
VAARGKSTYPVERQKKKKTKNDKVTTPVRLVAARGKSTYPVERQKKKKTKNDKVTTPVRLMAARGKSRRRRAYPQQIVTTRLLYCLQDPFAQLSRLQRIRSRACLNYNTRTAAAHFEDGGGVRLLGYEAGAYSYPPTACGRYRRVLAWILT